MARFFRIFLSLILIGVIGFSFYNIVLINREYEKESQMHEDILRYRPGPGPAAEKKPDEPFVNQNILDLQARNSDVVGWLHIDGTKIDYPFVWAKDNETYLRRDLNKNYASAGTVFMDYRCDKDFSGFNTILYGHNMKNDSMFGTLPKFSGESYFATNKTGKVYLADRTYGVEFFAYLVVKSSNPTVYRVDFEAPADMQDFFAYVQKNAVRYRDIGLSADDQVLTVSTCNYSFDNARSVLMGKLYLLES
ncbi:MAG: class B sortase [Oscillospiraceae bacterium]|nr:class B sortase [Oscillospiraceae bacterium]